MTRTDYYTVSQLLFLSVHMPITHTNTHVCSKHLHMCINKRKYRTGGFIT